jgi:dienelactone hydrolase
MRAAAALLAIGLLATACAGRVGFENLTPDAPVRIAGTLTRPAGPGPFPAVVILHGCHGVSPQLGRWAHQLRDLGYVSLVVDSFGPRRLAADCAPEAPDDLPITARFEDALGALRFLQAQPYVRGDRVGALGFSQGGVLAIAAINGPSLERARQRGVQLPEPGFAAGIGVYPGGCFSLIQERVVRPLLVLIGGADDWTLPEGCVEMVERMRERGADASIVVLPGVYHYFDVEGQPTVVLPTVGNRNKPGDCCGATVGYDAAAAAEARRRIAEFFSRHLAR